MIVPGIRFVQGKGSYADRDGKKYAIAIHATDNTASDEAEAAYAQTRTDGTSSHFYVDADSVIQSLDTDKAAGHAGSDQANQGAIAVEITGRDSWSRAQWLNAIDWPELGRAMAIVCKHHGIPVRRLTVAEMQRDGDHARGFYGHNDARLAWGHTTHTDPGPGFPWDRLLGTVQGALDRAGQPASEGEDVELTDKLTPWGSDTTVGGLLVTLDRRTNALTNQLNLGARLDEIRELAKQAIAEAADDPQLPEVPPLSDAAVQALADRLLSKLPAPSTPEAIADAVADEQAARLQS